MNKKNLKQFVEGWYVFCKQFQISNWDSFSALVEFGPLKAEYRAMVEIFQPAECELDWITGSSKINIFSKSYRDANFSEIIWDFINHGFGSPGETELANEN